GGDVFTTGSEVHVHLPPLSLNADATVRIDADTTGAPAALPDGAVRAGPAWRLDWSGAKLVHAGVLEMRAPAGETRALSIYGQPGSGAWQRLGGAPTQAGAPLSVPLGSPGRVALFAGGAPAAGAALGAITLAPRAFSPGGSFGGTDVAIGFALGSPAS